MADDLPPPGWYEDPWNACQPRWWDGAQWTEGGRPKVLPEEPSLFVAGLVAYRNFTSGNGPRPWWQMRRFMMPGGVFVGLMVVGVTLFLMATDEPPDRLANVDVPAVQVPVSIDARPTSSVPTSSTIVVTGEPVLGQARSTTTTLIPTGDKATTTTTESATTSAPSTTAPRAKASSTTSSKKPKASQTTTKPNGSSTTTLQTAQSSSTTAAPAKPGPTSTQQSTASTTATAPPTTAATTTTVAPATTAAPTTAASTTAATASQNADAGAATP